MSDERHEGEAARPRLLLGRIALLGIVHALLWAVLLPPWQAPDEPKHVEYVRLLARGGPLLAFASEDQGADLGLQREILASMTRHRFWWYGRAPDFDPAAPPTRFSEVWPLGMHSALYRSSPAYYWLAARLQPPGLEAGLYAARALSALLFGLVVLAAGLAARALFPDDPWPRYGAPLLLALSPMAAASHAGVNPDALTSALLALAFLAAVLAVARGLSAGPLLAMAGAWGAAVLVKRTALATTPMLLAAPLAAAALSARRPGRALAAAGGAALALALGGAALLRALPREARWTLLRYAFNEPDQPARILEALLRPEAWPYLAGFLRRIHDGAWGVYGWEAVRWPAPASWLYLALTLLAAAGLLRLGIARGLTRTQAAGLLVAATAVVSVLLAATAFFAGTLLQPYAVPPQGRYLILTVAPAWALLLIVGLGAWIPAGRRGPALAGLVALLLAWDLATVFGLVLPYYWA